MADVHIFDIKRCSFVDGPGIRTTVFFKGCNLRCKWCHNPESWTVKAQLAYFESRCVKCEACKANCAFGAVKDSFYPDAALCRLCGQCVEHCPTSARKIFGQTMSVDSVLEAVLSDKAFYEMSNGGVTLSGGECMLQEKGLYQILSRLKAEGIHTAVDTAGDVPWQSFERLMRVTDLWLYDIKCLNSTRHQALTGVGNERILDNYERLLSSGANVIVRVPVVPCTNDMDDEMANIAQYLATHKPQQVEWLPYHKMGENKAMALGKEPYHGTVPEDMRMAQIKEMQKN